MSVDAWAFLLLNEEEAKKQKKEVKQVSISIGDKKLMVSDDKYLWHLDEHKKLWRYDKEIDVWCSRNCAP